jgi:hypothetical protein
MRITNSPMILDAPEDAAEWYSNKCNKRTERIEESVGKSEYGVPAEAVSVAIIAEHLNNGWVTKRSVIRG